MTRSCWGPTPRLSTHLTTGIARPGHLSLDPRLADSSTAVAPVVIADDVFAMHAIVLKDVKSGKELRAIVNIGRGAVVADGSLVTRDVPPGAIVGSCPARVLGRAQSE